MDYLWLPLPSSLTLRETDIVEDFVPCKPTELRANLAMGLVMGKSQGI